MTVGMYDYNSDLHNVTYLDVMEMGENEGKGREKGHIQGQREGEGTDAGAEGGRRERGWG